MEEALNRHPNVDRAAVIGGRDFGTGEAVKAFIVLTEDGSAEQVLGWPRDPTTGMTGYRVPKYIEFRRSLPVDGGPARTAVLQTNKQAEKERQ